MSKLRFFRWNSDRLLSAGLVASATRPAVVHAVGGSKPLCILPGVHGSFGDEAMAEGIAALLGDGAVQMVAPGDTTSWPTPGGVASFDPMHRFFLPFVTAEGREVASAGGVLVVGADTLSGAYDHNFLAWRVALLNQAVSAGRPAVLLNFSFPEKPTTQSLRILHELDARVDVWARDAKSQERFARLMSRDVSLAPDVAAMMRPAQIGGVEPTPHHTITLVPNMHFDSLGITSAAELRAQWTDLGRDLARDFVVTFLPHDVRESVGDVAMCREVTAALQLEGYSVECFVPETAAQAKGFLAMQDVCVSARMHAAVGALSSGVPVVGISYLGKFAGQFAFYGAEDCVVDASELADTARIRGAIQLAEAGRAGLRTIDESAFGWANGLS